MTMTDDVPAWMKPPKTLEYTVFMPGACIRVWRAREDGFRRVDIEEYETKEIRLYMTAEEREQAARAIWPEGWPETA